MGRGGVFSSIDAFGKTMEDVRIRTRTGAFLTILSLSLIATLTLMEWVDYRQLKVEPSIVVDKSRGEKLVVDMNITFPRVPCYLLSIDIMDISGEHQNDLTHDINKSRIAADGSLIDMHSKNLKGDFDRIANSRAADYCGSCYGGTPSESGCCNSCEEVRESYTRRGWSFTNPEGIDQCVQEGWAEKIAEQNTEGCNVAGRVKVNKVVGNFHLSPGKSFQANSMHVHDLVPYLRSGNHHDFGHTIHSFSFGADVPEESEEENNKKKKQKKKQAVDVKKRLGIINPLDAVTATTDESNYMFQYFVKVVSTQFHPRTGDVIPTHQYSVTSYERDMSAGSQPGKDEHGHMTAHGTSGIPGVFFAYEISPMLVIHTEYRQSFAHFITSTMAIIGGVLTVFQLLDGVIFSGRRKLTGVNPDPSSSFSNRDGKLL